MIIKSHITKPLIDWSNHVIKPD